MVRVLLAFHWLLTGAAVLAALAAFVKARRVSKRLDRLTESYWELRYEHGQLRARFARVDPERRAVATDHSQQPPGPAPVQPLPHEIMPDETGATAFIPVSALKR